MIAHRPRHRIAALLSAIAVTGCASAAGPRAGAAPEAEMDALVQQVEIRRTHYGVPHILAQNLRAAAFALAYVQLEDHGERIIEGMNAARGRAALVNGERRIDSDADARRRLARARIAFDSLHQDTRDVYAGFAAGMNHYIRTHAAELPGWVRPDYSAHDILARDIVWPSAGAMNRFRERLTDARTSGASADSSAGAGWGRWVIAEPASVEPTVEPPAVGFAATEPTETEPAQLADNVGSNAWALAPSRTTSGHAILLRNPHLSWTAGYYEAHVRVPGRLDFYGDFRIGGPFTVIGGFNPHLGFATTNNAARSHEFYALRMDPDDATRYLIDGASVPLRRESVTVEVRDSSGRVSRAVREFWSTELGPVVHHDTNHVYIFRSAAAGNFRAGEQWLKMMQAGSLAEWQDAMRIGARTTSNFTYADRAGNIHYVWMSGAPALPHAEGGDTLAIPANRTAELWTARMPYDSMPQLLNPPGGYVRNENDSPHFTNLNAIIAHSFRFPVEPPSLRLRSQHALELLHNDRRFSLEDVVEAKHSMRMLLADRVKPDLLDALRAARDDGDTTVDSAAALLEQWDNTASAATRGSVLFELWWNRYRRLMDGDDLFAVEWSEAEPMTTPRGLANIDRAIEAFEWAVPAAVERFGSWDVAWGDVHRVRRGDVDVPVGGCGGALGCFRVLNFRTDDDGRRVVNGGDGWVLAVEFGEVPRAYSILAYGQSPDPGSPWHDDQAALFAANRMKPVLWTEEDIARGTVLRYRPGQETH